MELQFPLHGLSIWFEIIRTSIVYMNHSYRYPISNPRNSIFFVNEILISLFLAKNPLSVCAKLITQNIFVNYLFSIVQTS